MSATGLVVLDTEDALRDHLDALNEAGRSCETSGVDRDGNAFLTVLAGPAADYVAVLYGNPWDCDVVWGEPEQRCDECGAQNQGATAESLRYPVTVIATEVPE